MFQFRRFPSYTYVFSIWYMSFSHMDCSIRISAGLCSLTTRRSFSQLTTSFFGSQCQGIRPALLLALPFVRFEFSLIHCSFFTRLIFLNRVVSLDCISSYFSYSIFKFPFSILFQEQKLTDNSLSINFHSWLVGTSGLEPPTSRLSGVRSNHLSYAPNTFLVEMRRIELLTPCLQSRCSPSWATPPTLPRYLQNRTMLPLYLTGTSQILHLFAP